MKMNKWLVGLKESSFVFGLSRIKRLLKILGNPERCFPSIHITGSNGKGSVSIFISSVLVSAGYKVGLYTSPHLTDFRERIRINNEMIPEERLNTIIKRVKKASRGLDITYFEAATAIAFLYFKEERVSIGIIEVGLGGRLDATNVITPLVSVITNISLEHTNYLGNTIEKIAKEKAGIIKKGIPVVAPVIMKRYAKMKKCEIFINGIDFEGSGTSEKFNVKAFQTYKDLSLRMLGDHQVKNASFATMALEIIKRDFPWNPSHLKKGLENAYIKGRMELISKEPLVILDGAHNPDAARILREALNSYFKGLKPIFIIGILKDKDKDGFLSNLGIFSHKVIVTEPKIDRKCPKEELFEIAKKYTQDVYLCNELKDALEYAKNIVQKDELICICGSLYLVGEAIDKALKQG